MYPAVMAGDQTSKAVNEMLHVKPYMHVTLSSGQPAHDADYLASHVKC